MIPVPITSSLGLIPYNGVESYVENYSGGFDDGLDNVDSVGSLDGSHQAANEINPDTSYGYGADGRNDIMQNDGFYGGDNQSLDNLTGEAWLSENLAFADGGWEDSTAGDDVLDEGVSSGNIRAAAIVWLAGMVLILGYLAVGSILLKRRLANAIPLEADVYQCDRIGTPFVFGIFKAKIYLPFTVKDDERRFIIEHERMHIRHKDNIVKIIGFILLSVYWFVPFVWLFWTLLGRDMEAFCDESVIRKLGYNAKKDYANALLNCAEKKLKLPVYPAAFGGSGMKSRVKNILNYKKAAFWSVTVMSALAVILVVCFVPSGKNPSDKENTMVDESGSAGDESSSVRENEKTVKQYPGNYAEPVLWYEDLTGDGIDEIIAVNISTDDLLLNTVDVYSGQTNQIIWRGEAGEDHATQNGWYIYYESGQAYLLNWTPYENTGRYSDYYRVFCLTETGQEQNIAEDEFSADEEYPEQKDFAYAEKFYDNLKPILENSFVLVDTQIESCVEKYSKPDNLIRPDADRLFLRASGSLLMCLMNRDKAIVWREDLTHDGKPERIEVKKDIALTRTVNPEHEEDYTGVTVIGDTIYEEYDLAFINIYSGETGELIWRGYAGYDRTPGVDQKGYYIYHDSENQAYMILWQPYMYEDGSAEYSCRLFSLSETGDEIVEYEESMLFSLNTPLASDAENIEEYLKKVNGLLGSSYVLVDTGYEELFFSGKDAPVTREFDSGEILRKINEAIEEMRKPVIWYEDLTHDGADERIEVDLNYLDGNSDADAKTVAVYSGQTDELIWSGHADNVHIGWNGYYVYHDPSDGKAYLLMWQPYMSTGYGNYIYKLFYLSETGKEHVIEEDSYEFYETHPEADDAENLTAYGERVNTLLKESYVLIDTDNGSALYSGQDNPVTRGYDMSEIIRWINYFRENDEKSGLEN